MKSFAWLHVTVLCACALFFIFDETLSSSAGQLDEGWYWCFEDKCRCQGHVANCASNTGKLSFVPRLPAEITMLDFSNNFACPPKFLFGSESIPIPDDFFVNVTSITSLEFSNIIAGTHYYFSDNVFSVFNNLTTFVGRYCLQEHDYGKPSMNLFAALYAAPTLRNLQLNCIAENPINLRLPLLENLNLDGSHLRNLNPFAHMKSLNKLSLKDTLITPITDEPLEVETLELVRVLWISEFPPTCSPNGTTYFPRLLKLDMSENPHRSFSLPTSACLPKLRYLNLSGNNLTLQTNSFATWKFPNLQTLEFSAMPYYVNIFTKATVRIHRLNFGNDNVHPDSFRDCSSLTTLILSGHDFSTITNAKVERLFHSGLPSLQTLKLDRCDLKKITSLTFAGLSSLRALNLSGNELSHIPTDAFSALASLEELDLSNNVISVIQDGAFSGLTSLRMLDLSDNKLACNCSMVYFRRWNERYESVFAKFKGTYACSNLSDTDVFTYRVSAQSCMFARDTFVMIFDASLLALLCQLVALCVLGWRTRRNVRKFLREMVKMQRLRQALHLQQPHWDYDLFVAYAEEDADWVQEQLKARVEDEWGLRLCLHYRDFHPGRRVLDNIESCLEKSRKMMVVFSPHFANSRWCQLELGVGLQHAMDRNDELLVVYLSPVPPDDLTAGMAAILRSCTYLRWAERGTAVAVFWNSLRAVLPRGRRVARV